jgi:hypothetical protein
MATLTVLARLVALMVLLGAAASGGVQVRLRYLVVEWGEPRAGLQAAWGCVLQ